jgi:membrane fusion protein, multidrug efflux system
MKRKHKIWLAVAVGLVLVFGSLAGVKAAQIGTMIKAGATFAPPPEAVSSAVVQQIAWESSRSAIGSLVPVRGVTLAAEVMGLVREISFDSGQSVRKGAVLVRLDTSGEEAQLAAAKADASLAKLSLTRARNLRAAEANAPADLDAAVAKSQAAEAAVTALEATIGRKTIRAPFDGKITIRQVELGQVLAPGTPVAALLSVTPIHADFFVPQQALADLQTGQKVRLRTDTFPGAGWQGAISTVNPEVDPATRNVRVRATFENPDGRLRPGMFVNVDVLSGETRQTLVVPATAVLYAPYGDSVYVLEEKKDEKTGQVAMVAQQRFIRAGDRRGDFVAVVDGLKKGETIVSSGAFKLRNGMAVAVNNALAPDPKLAPRPENR